MNGMVAITGNTFPVKDRLKDMGGRWDPDAKCWKVPANMADMARALVPAYTPRPAATNVGSMTGLIALFDEAKRRSKGRLKKAAFLVATEIITDPDGTRRVDEDKVVRLSLAGPTAKVPGSITLTSGHYTGFDEMKGYKTRDWYGRVKVDGTFEPTREAGKLPGMTAALERMAASPAETASEYGRLTGRCCFCALPLSAGRSTEVGYGETCANKYGMPWGKAKVTKGEKLLRSARPTVFAAEAA